MEHHEFLNQNLYYVFITTDERRSILEINVAGNLIVRLVQLEEQKYAKRFLLYWEGFDTVQNALKRELAINKLTKKRKTQLIDAFNPGWQFFNDSLLIRNSSYE